MCAWHWCWTWRRGAESFLCDDAEVVLIACNTPARTAKGAVQDLRNQGMAPVLMGDFPSDADLAQPEQTFARPRIVR